MIIPNYTQYEQRWQDIYGALKSAGVDVFSSSQKLDKCEAPYVVIRNAGTDKLVSMSSTQTIYELLLYVPADNYTMLDLFTDEIKTIMKSLYPMIVSLHSEIADFVDDDVKAHMRVLQYRNVRKISNL